MTSPNHFKSILLSDCNSDQQRQFAAMLASACATEDLQNKGHRCWFHLIKPNEYELMRKYVMPPFNEWCPKCKNRLIAQVYHCSLTGSNISIVCMGKDKGTCDFSEPISDLDNV